MGVADDAQVETVASPGLEQLHLQRVDVLELVDEQVPEAPPLGGCEPGVGLHVVAAQPQQVVEVDQPPAALLVLVALVQLGHPLGRAGDPPPGRGDRCHVAVGAGQAGLGPLDLRRDLAGGERPGPRARAGPRARPRSQQLTQQAALAGEERRGLPALQRVRSWA